MSPIQVCLAIAAVVATVHGQEVCTSREADIVFVLDSSGSVGSSDFDKELSFVNSFVEGFSFGPSGVQFSVVTYSSTTTTQFNLNQYSNQGDFQTAVTNIQYRGGGTNTAEALAHVRLNSFLTVNGGRPGVMQIVIVITDGASNDRTATAREATLLHNLGIKVFSVGVGNSINMEELLAIASDNSSVFTVSDFDALSGVKKDIQSKTCTTINNVCTSRKADVVFLLDSSGSVRPADFDKELSFVNSFVEGFSFGPSGVQFSVVTYSSTTTTRFNLNQYNNQGDFQTAVTNIQYTGGGTKTAEALAHARLNSFLPVNGGRPGVMQIVIVITDGASNDRTATAREATLLHNLGIKVFSVGVGNNINMEELLTIASDNSSVFTVSDFDALSSAKKDIQNKTCTTIDNEQCGRAVLTVTSRILNAPVAQRCEWPWVVSVRLGLGDIPTLMCAGVLIGKRKVITTASCVIRENVHSVVVGENNILVDNEVLTSANTEKSIRVARTELHPQHRGKEFDVAVLHLVEDVEYNSCVLPACLPSAETCQKEVMKECAFAGWGIHSETSISMSQLLRVGYGQYISPDTCAVIYKSGRNATIPDNMGCIDPNVKSQSPCWRDDGGMVSCNVQGRWVLRSLINVPNCQDVFPSLGVHLSHPDILSFVTKN